MAAAALSVGLVLGGCSSGSSGTPDASRTNASTERGDTGSTATGASSPTPSGSGTPSAERTGDAHTSSSPAPARTTSAPRPTTTTGGGTSGQGGPNRGTYTVTISGQVGSNTFRRTGTVRVRDTVARVGTTNGVNAVDVCLISGSPAARPEVGAIWLGSNSACNPGANAANMDMGYVTVAGSKVTFQPDQRMSATSANHFTANAGLTACPYVPVSGELTVSVGSTGSLSGSVRITGYGGAMCGQVPYQATITGGSA